MKPTLEMPAGTVPLSQKGSPLLEPEFDGVDAVQSGIAE
jgi:hypothetical protein